MISYWSSFHIAPSRFLAPALASKTPASWTGFSIDWCSNVPSRPFTSCVSIEPRTAHELSMANLRPTPASIVEWGQSAGFSQSLALSNGPAGQQIPNAPTAGSGMASSSPTYSMQPYWEQQQQQMQMQDSRPSSSNLTPNSGVGTGAGEDANIHEAHHRHHHPQHQAQTHHLGGMTNPNVSRTGSKRKADSAFPGRRASSASVRGRLSTSSGTGASYASPSRRFSRESSRASSQESSS